MRSPEFITWSAAFAYLFASVFGLGGMIAKRSAWRTAGGYLALCAFLTQTISLVFGYHGLLPEGLSVGAYLQLLAWFLLLCGLATWYRAKNDTLLLFSAPLGMILFFMSGVSLRVALRLPEFLSAWFYATHVGALFLSLGLVCVSFIAGTLFLLARRGLKAKKKLPSILNDAPALAVLDKINAVCVIFAFPLYTIGLAAGFFWAAPVFGATISGDPKEIVSLLIWLGLAILFHNRLVKGWKGRKPAILAIIIFFVSLFSFVVVNLALSTNHAFFRN